MSGPGRDGLEVVVSVVGEMGVGEGIMVVVMVVVEVVEVMVMERRRRTTMRFMTSR